MRNYETTSFIPQNSWTHGLGGETGYRDGKLYLSNRDRATYLSKGAREKADQAERDLKSGQRPDYLQVENLKAQAKEFEDEAATGGRSKTMLAQPTAEANWEDLNGWGADKYMPRDQQRFNTGARWGGFQAAGNASDAAGITGIDYDGGAPSGMREASYSRGGERPLISNASGGRIVEHEYTPGGFQSRFANSGYSAFSGEAYRQDKGLMNGTAGGYAGIQPPQQQQRPIPNIRNYGWDITSPTDPYPTPMQMRGDYNHGRFENVTEDGYDPVKPPTDWTATRKQPGAFSQEFTSQLDGSPVTLRGQEGVYDNTLPPPDKIAMPDDWNDEEDAAPKPELEQIKDSIANRAEQQESVADGLKGSKRLNALAAAADEQMMTERALQDYIKKGFLPNYKPEASARPGEMSAYQNTRESGQIKRRQDSAAMDAISSLTSGGRQAVEGVKNFGKKVLDLYPPELKDDPRFSDVRTNVRRDGKMSRAEAKSAGEILSPKEQEAVEQYKQRQLIEELQVPKSSALAQDNRIAMDVNHAPIFEGEIIDKRNRHEFNPVGVGEIDAQMGMGGKSKREQAGPRKPLTHRDLLARFLSSAMGGGMM